MSSADPLPSFFVRQKRFLIVGIIFLLWLVISVLLIDRTGSVIVDGFQSIGAIAGSDRPGSLHWPMVGSFMGFDQTWGFHWVGWPLLRSVVIQILPWNPLAEVFVVCALWAMSAWTVMRLALHAEDSIGGYWVGLICLAAPSFMVAAQSYRPEILTALLLLIALRYWKASAVSAAIIRSLCLVALPLLHPLGLIVPSAWLGWDLLRSWKSIGFFHALRSLIVKGGFLLTGALGMVAWFALQPDAWMQFQSNIQSQRVLTEGLGPGYWAVMRWGYGSFGSLPMIILLLGALVGSAYVLVIDERNQTKSTESSLLVYVAVGFGSALLFNLLAKNPNSIHMMAVMPLAAWLYVIAINRILCRWNNSFQVVAMLGTILLFWALPGKNAYLLGKQQGLSYRDELGKALQSLPESRKTLIPVAFWEAAQLQNSSRPVNYQFSTFPNILVRDQRMLYEEQVIADLQAGDLLVWDPLQESGGIFNFVEATALRHILIRPKDQSEWEQLESIHIPVRYSKNQSVDFEVYRKR